MTRISAPYSGLGEHIDWALLRPEMAAGMGKLSAAVYGNSQLSVREREAARWTIALDQRLRRVPRHQGHATGSTPGADEPFYAEVTDWRAATGLSERERLRRRVRRALRHRPPGHGRRVLGAACTRPTPRTSWPTSPSAAACSSAWAAPWPWSACGRPTSASSSDRADRRRPAGSASVRRPGLARRPAANSSTIAWATSSWYCTGGDFMK